MHIHFTGGITHPIGTLSMMAFIVSSATGPAMPVLTKPGDTLFTRANPSHSMARDLPINCVSIRRNDSSSMHANGSRTEMYDGRLGGIVHGLAARNIDNVARHAGGSNEATTVEALEFSPVNRRALLLLPAKVLASHMSAVRHAVGVDAHGLVVPRNLGVDKRRVTP